MVYSPHPLTVDGVQLDSYAWNIQSKVRQIAGSRNGDVPVPGVDGVAASLNDDLEPTTYTLSMWVLGTDPNGLVPADANAVAQCRANVDFLSYVFGRRYSLMDVREVVDSAGTVRQAFCKVTDAIAPEIRAGGLGRFTVVLQIPQALFQDPDPRDWTLNNLVSGNFYEVTTMRGSTAPITDGVVTVTGPATNPQLNDFATGRYCRLNAVLPAGQTWRVNSDTWATRYGAGLTLASLDSDGTDAQATTRHGGGTARFFPLYPVWSAGALRVQIGLSATSMTTATTLGVRARRKFRQ